MGLVCLSVPAGPMPACLPRLGSQWDGVWLFLFGAVGVGPGVQVERKALRWLAKRWEAAFPGHASLDALLTAAGAALL